MPEPTADTITQFIARWEKSGGSEKANYALFFTELCDEILLVPHPEPAGPDNEKNLYSFERVVTHKAEDGTTATGFIDLYKAGCFLLETKQGTFLKATSGGTLLDFLPTQTNLKSGHGKRGTLAFDKILQRAYNQARKYITAVPPAEGRPPFLIVCDVGHTIDLYAEFTGTGGHYERFPDPNSHRIFLSDLHRPEIRQRLRQVWTEPHALDPAKHAAAVTREVAKALAELAKSLESDGQDPQLTAGFLQRCLFTMFAEDVGLLPEKSFVQLLEKVKDSPAGFPIMLQTLWKDMAKGTDFSTVLLSAIPHFNGGLFEDCTAFPLRQDQIALLIHAAKSDWSAVEPAIFGTLVERALDARERHKLGAHYTPRSYVERLVRPTLMDPLRAEWEAVKAAAALSMEKATKADATATSIENEAQQKLHTLTKAQADALNKRRLDAVKQATAHRADAMATVSEFHRKLCTLRVLDPACGSGNFLYVCLELMKRLEAEVLELFEALGGDLRMEMASFKIGPRQFLGLELNRRAVAIAQLVLWIGFFQWQRKTTGKADTNERPLLPKDPSILQQDAVLAYDKAIPRLDAATGNPITIWDGQTTKLHPITGKEVPDETARRLVYDYTNPRRADWPEADIIVGNPPFIGASRMRDALGDGYVETLRQAWKGRVPESADFVMFWWQKAAELVRDGRTKRFGFITTNSIHQTFNRRVIEPFLAEEKQPLHLSYAIPDHPWVDSADGAAVRISMTVAEPGKGEGTLAHVENEIAREDGENEVELSERNGVVAANLQVGADLTSASELASNLSICWEGMKPHGKGFLVTPEEADALGYWKDNAPVFPLGTYINGRDVVDVPRKLLAIDLFGFTEAEAAQRFPSLINHLLVEVKPERDMNNRETYRKNWWFFGEARKNNRPSLKGLHRFIVTVKTAKHRAFTFLDSSCIPDSKLIVVASEAPEDLAVLSSLIHSIWTLRIGSHLGVGNDPTYVVGSSFNKFPFPDLPEGPLKQRIRDLGERLDSHRKKQQAQHPDLTLTGLYNVLEAVRLGTPLTAKEKVIHDHGLVSILKQIHDDLDTAVLEAYGWTDLMSPAQNLSLADRLATPGPAAEALEQELLTRLVALNHTRAAEEKQGHIRWLRPEYQAVAGASSERTAEGTEGTKATQGTEGTAEPKKPKGRTTASAKATKVLSDLSVPLVPSVPEAAPKLPWPESLAAQVSALQKLLPTHGPDPEALSARFGKKSPKRTEQISEILETLQALGQC